MSPSAISTRSQCKIRTSAFPGEENKLNCQSTTFVKPLNESLRLIKFKDVIRISTEDAVHNGIFFSVCCLQKTHSTFM